MKCESPTNLIPEPVLKDNLYLEQFANFDHLRSQQPEFEIQLKVGRAKKTKGALYYFKNILPAEMADIYFEILKDISWGKTEKDQ